jgi:hypothetical protein
MIIVRNYIAKENRTQVNLVMLLPMHCHASYHTFHRAKACIIYLHVVHT